MSLSTLLDDDAQLPGSTCHLLAICDRGCVRMSRVKGIQVPADPNPPSVGDHFAHVVTMTDDHKPPQWWFCRQQERWNPLGFSMYWQPTDSPETDWIVENGPQAQRTWRASQSVKRLG